MSNAFTKTERSWVVYDVGNSAFALIISTTIYTIFFNTISQRAGLAPEDSTTAIGLINAAAFLLIAIISPLLGTFADYQGNKKKLFSAFAFLGIISVSAMMLVGDTQWLLAAVIYNIAMLGFAGANIFYNAFLLDVSPKDRLDKVSAAGFAWGYIGSTIPFVITLGIIFAFFKNDDGITMMGFASAFLITAVWWLIFTVPLLKNVEQKYGIPPSKTPFKDTWRRLAQTVAKIKQKRAIYLFLIGYFLYIDGVDTIIVMAMDFGMKNSTMGQVDLVLVVLAIQIIAWPSTLLYGRLSESLGTRTMILFGITTYGVITLVAALMESMPSSWINGAFILLAVLIGTAQGGVQSLSRSYFGSLIPPEQSAEFFGFFNIFGKFAAILGPALIALFTYFMKGHIVAFSGLQFTGYSLGVLSLMVFFIVGGMVFVMADREAKKDLT
ncbi:Vacuole effluxer Atg22 like protein [Marinomonas spartinae]|uniref:MFS transporter n=1 Tax=Marinomonas spartinae TaxID=1792290 RepID=UPI000808F0CF|nr:MFS transporter [Marinomonas spartinae]SBS28011.1 Vacuole effluxer Atg22 like protein [Marinomonas spartinae]